MPGLLRGQRLKVKQRLLPMVLRANVCSYFLCRGVADGAVEFALRPEVAARVAQPKLWFVRE